MKIFENLGRMTRSKKGIQAAVGALSALVTIGLLFVVWGISSAYGQKVMSDVGATFTAGGYAANTTENSQAAIQTLTSSGGTLANVIIAAVIITVLVAAFAGFIYAKQ